MTHPADSQATRVLTVGGHGRAAPGADLAEVTLGVEVVRPTAAEVRAAAAEAMGGVLAAMRALAIPDGDVRTTDLSLGPEIEYPPDGAPRRIGYRLVNRVAVRIANPDRVAEVVDRAVEAGATTLDGVEFKPAEPGSARRAALRAAVEDARASAETLAAAAGAALGPLLSIREITGQVLPPTPRFALMEAQAADTPIMPGTAEVVASVEVAWALE